MEQVTFKGKPIHLIGNFPIKNSIIPNFTLVTQGLEDKTLAHFKGQRKLLATVPSLDTDVCSMMTKHLNDIAQSYPDITIIVVSADLPFAQKRFCVTEAVQHVNVLSMMRNKDFGKAYGVLIQDGPLAGLLARSLMITDENNKIIYAELVSEITHEPDYQKALKIMGT